MSHLNEKLINIKDVKSFDELDFTKIDLTRGETPPDIKHTCLQLCKDYLCGNWFKQTVDSIEVRRVSGGLTNQLYYCGICEPKTNDDTPQEVVIKLYERKHSHKGLNERQNERLSDIIIDILVSNNGLGPKIYGVFEGGEIQKYYQHRQFIGEEHKNPMLVRQVWGKLAQIHALDVPIERNTDWYFTHMDKSYEIIDKHSLIDVLVEEFRFDVFKGHDLKAEIDWIKSVINKVQSPIVFVHNDFRSSNIMITQDMNNNEEVVVVCDYEYSCHTFRGIDFVHILNEWQREQFDTRPATPVDDTVVASLLQIYIEESKRIFGPKYAENAINSLEHLIKEWKVFSLSANIWNFLFIVSKTVDKDNEFIFNRSVSMEFAEKLFSGYLSAKKTLIETNIL